MSYFNYKSKQIYYCKTGKGRPVVFLHGNTASSKMFDLLLPLYQQHFTIILIDFLGHGKSDRINQFPDDIWFDEALQTIVLLEHLGYEKTDLVGTSGGAYAAINAALERPDLINKVVADSFEGRTLSMDFVPNLVKERTMAKADPYASQFYKWCQGDDWESIVDKDTETLIKLAESGRPLFHQPLEILKVPILLMGSKEDSMVENMLDEYSELKNIIPQCSLHIFENGEHPAIASNPEEAAQIICDFLK